MEPNELEKAADDALDELEELDEENVVYLTDEDGQEVACELLDEVSYNGAVYVVLLPLDDESGEVAILRMEDASGDEARYAAVDDDSELEAVFAIFREQNEENFHFE